jgi:hypothetical protein
MQAAVWAPGGPFFTDFLSNGLWMRIERRDERGVCVVIIDEDTIDNGHLNVEEAAAQHKVQSDWLVNDDRPTEIGNPWLRWNTDFAGDITILPGGQVDDEGWFALPKDTPWPVADFVAGIVPQSRLDKIKNVMPLRNQDLARMIGHTCVAVVYDSDISMNYLEINANLQGERYGLFAFKVLDAVLAGTRPESKSSTSLYDLRVRVLGPMTAGSQFLIPVHDHEPDAVAITLAQFRGGVLTVEATSTFGKGSITTCSVDGALFEAPMQWQNGRFVLRFPSHVDLQGRRVCVSTDHGGAYNSIVR